MNAVKKFETFEQLKSFEKETLKYASALKKHNEFEKVIMEIMSIKNLQIVQTKLKQ